MPDSSSSRSGAQGRPGQRIARLARQLSAAPAAAAAASSKFDSSSSSDGRLRVDLDDEGIATITFNRPEAKNAFTFRMLEDFQRAILELGTSPACRVVILTGAGDSFCTGTDLKELDATSAERRGRTGEKDDEEERKARLAAMPSKLKAWSAWFITHCPKPVICALNGMAVGMGVEFATMCDVRLMSEKAQVCWIFGKRGLVPDWGLGTWMLPKIVGHSHALRLLYRADFVGARELEKIGFANEVVPHEELLDAAKREARSYLTQSPLSLRLMKRQLYLGLESSLGEHLLMHQDLMKICFASEDHQEGVKSFIEKRPPRFTGALPESARKLKSSRLLE